MESKTKNRKTRAELQKMVERAFPGFTLAEGDEAITELKEGWFNVAYNIRLSDGRDVILKIAPPPNAEILTYEKDIMTTEVSSMRQAAQNPGIPVPEIYAYDDKRDLCDSNYFFMEKLRGQNYEHVKKQLPSATVSQIESEIGAIIREINSYTGSYFGYNGNPDLRAATWKEAFIKICDSVLDDGVKKNAEYPYSVEELRSVIRENAAVLDEVTTPCMVHWDAWDPNFFVEDGHITGILDFERVLWADPLMEAQFRALAWGGVTDALRSYGKVSFTHAEDVRNHLYTLHLALVMKTEDYYRHYDTQEVSNMGKAMILQSVTWLRENQA